MTTIQDYFNSNDTDTVLSLLTDELLDRNTAESKRFKDWFGVAAACKEVLAYHGQKPFQDRTTLANLLSEVLTVYGRTGKRWPPVLLKIKHELKLGGPTQQKARLDQEARLEEQRRLAQEENKRTQQVFDEFRQKVASSEEFKKLPQHEQVERQRKFMKERGIDW